MTVHAYICDAIRTPFGRYGGALASVRPDDLAAVAIKALVARNPGVRWEELDDAILGCANRAGEDNRNVARMATLLAGLPIEVPGATVNRLCGSGLDAIGGAARAIRAGEAGLMLAGGVESMSRAPFVMGKADSAYSRSAAIYDTTIGWRFINKLMKAQYGVDSMPETAENVADDFKISREDQDLFALASQKTARAQKEGYFDAEIVPVSIAQKKGDPIIVSRTSIRVKPRWKRKLKGVVREGGRDGRQRLGRERRRRGAAAGRRKGCCPPRPDAARARVGMATAGVAPRIMGIGPAPATRKVLAQTGLTLEQMDVIELNEAFAAQGLAVLRQLGIADNDPRVNPNGGAIALGHPLGASGARLATTAINQLHRTGGRYALCTMCIGVGQGIALIIERV